MRNRILLSVLLILLLGAAAISLYILYGSSPRSNTESLMIFQEKYNDAKALHNVDDYNSALDAFRKLAQEAPDKASEGKANIFVAANLFARNQGDDRAGSIQLYMSILNDPAMPAYVRAKVLTELAGIAKVVDPSSYALYFNNTPFRDFLPVSGSNSARTNAAYLKLLELSDETHPNSYAEYLIAGNHYAPLLVNNNLIGDTTPEQAARMMQDYIQKADALAPSDESSYRPRIQVERYFYRALALTASNRVLQNIPLANIENAYKLVLNKGEPYAGASDPGTMSMVMRGRFYYANFLMEFFGQERHADIVALLKPFAAASVGTDAAYTQTRTGFMRTFVNGTSNFLKERAAALAEISPEFKQFLTGIGFTS